MLSMRTSGLNLALLSPSRSTEGINRDSYDGTYKSHAVTLGIFLGYSF